MQDPNISTPLESEKSRIKAGRLFCICLLLILAVDFFVPKHGHFDWENIPGFYAFCGFAGCSIFVVIAHLFSRIVRKKEDYYD